MKIIYAVLFFTVLHVTAGYFEDFPVLPPQDQDNKVKAAPLVILYPIGEPCEFR